MEKSRLEAFSDGVFAIAITLLALDLTVPMVGQGHLAGALGDEWPRIAAYLVSFAVIGIIWINHHTIFRMVREVDRLLLVLNLGLLLTVVTLPFSTNLFATYLRQGGDNSHIAAAVYSADMLAMAVAFSVIYRALIRDAEVLHEQVDLHAARANSWRFSLGLFFYTATVGISFLSAPATLAVHFAMAVYYLVDQVTGRVQPSQA